MEQICITNCLALPEVSFSVCNPQIYTGQVTTLYLSALGHYLVNPSDPNEWAARISLPVGDPAKIIVLSGIGDKPAPEINQYFGAYGKNYYSNKNHVLNFTIRELPDLNYNAMRYFEIHKKALAWFQTSGGKTSGGVGIPVTVNFNQIIPETFTELENLTGSITWENKLHPVRNSSVI